MEESVDAVPCILADPVAVAGTRESLLLVSIPRRDESALCVLRVLGNDVDHAVHRVGAPHGRARTADHLDTLDIFEHRVLKLPVDSGEERCVDAASVDQHEQLVGVLAVESARRDSPGLGVDASHLDSWHHAKEIGNVGRSRAPDIFARQDIYRGGCFGQGLRLPRH